MIKAVIFDLDGTIGNTLALCVAAFKKTIEPIIGREFSNEEIIATFGPSEEGTIMKLIPEHYDNGIAGYLEAYKELHGMCSTPFEGMEDILKWLKSKNIIVALVTGKGRKSCDITLDVYQMADFFDMVETGSPEGPIKPEGIMAVLNKFNLNPNEAIYVGDAPSDVISSRKVGVPVISAAWADTADVEELKKLNPDEIFTTVDELKNYLEGLMDSPKIR